jgi:hypothetical protein
LTTQLSDMFVGSDTENSILLKSNEMLSAEVDNLMQENRQLRSQLERAGIKPSDAGAKRMDSLRGLSNTVPLSTKAAVNKPGSIDPIKVYLVKDQLFEELYSLAASVYSNISVDCDVVDAVTSQAASNGKPGDCVFRAIDRVGDFVDGKVVLEHVAELDYATQQLKALQSRLQGDSDSKEKRADQSLPEINSSAAVKDVNHAPKNASSEGSATARRKRWSLWGGDKKADTDASRKSSRFFGLLKGGDGATSAMDSAVTNTYTMTEKDWAVVMKVVRQISDSMRFLHCRMEEESGRVANTQTDKKHTANELSYQVAENKRIRSLYRHLETDLCRVKFLLAMCQEKLDDKLAECVMVRQLLASYIEGNRESELEDALGGGGTISRESSPRLPSSPGTSNNGTPTVARLRKLKSVSSEDFVGSNDPSPEPDVTLGEYEPLSTKQFDDDDDAGTKRRNNRRRSLRRNVSGNTGEMVDNDDTDSEMGPDSVSKDCKQELATATAEIPNDEGDTADVENDKTAPFSGLNASSKSLMSESLGSDVLSPGKEFRDGDSVDDADVGEVAEVENRTL